MESAPQNHIHNSASKYQYKPEWYFEKGLRKVNPYFFQFSTYAKERWRGRSIIDVFSTDFRDRSPEYYAHAVASGVIKINGKNITKDVIIKNGDLITNMIHRHEPPVTGDPVRILHRDDERGLLVVEKPGSMPVHPTGRYNYNTMLSILRFDYDLPLVHTSNRLDRLTSGVMVCALTLEASKGLSTYFSTEGAVKKEYIARCRGCFPDEEVICEEPLLTIDRQVGLNVVHPEGKHARTVFKKLNYDPLTNSSVVQCKPITGRSHQIRVHLQFLGFPILNDTIYCDIKAWGPNAGKGGMFGKSPKEADRSVNSDTLQNEPSSRAALCDDALPKPNIELNPAVKSKLGKSRRQGLSQAAGKRIKLDHDPVINESNCSTVLLNELAIEVISELRKSRDVVDDFGRNKDTLHIDKAFRSPEEIQSQSSLTLNEEDQGKFCAECGIPLLPDPRPEQLYIYLHAYSDTKYSDLSLNRYQTDSWEFSSSMPWWAIEEKWKFHWSNV
ncbi:pseudouridine synthase [Phakopsora pachyrhizi]|nr:pseudouridine synthase [Phakopsora pachyrhizi]